MLLNVIETTHNETEYIPLLNAVIGTCGNSCNMSYPVKRDSLDDVGLILKCCATLILQTFII